MELMDLRARFYLDQPSLHLLDRRRLNSPRHAACIFRRDEADRKGTGVQSLDQIGPTAHYLHHHSYI